MAYTTSRNLDSKSGWPSFVDGFGQGNSNRCAWARAVTWSSAWKVQTRRERWRGSVVGGKSSWNLPGAMGRGVCKYYKKNQRRFFLDNVFVILRKLSASNDSFVKRFLVIVLAALVLTYLQQLILQQQQLLLPTTTRTIMTTTTTTTTTSIIILLLILLLLPLLCLDLLWGRSDA